MSEPTTETPPGDPNGSLRYMRNQIAFGHSIECLYGWEYRSTYVPADQPFGSGPPPAPYGGVETNPNRWERNTYMGKDGYETVSDREGQRHRTYWRRRKA